MSYRLHLENDNLQMRECADWFLVPLAHNDKRNKGTKTFIEHKLSLGEHRALW